MAEIPHPYDVSWLAGLLSGSGSFTVVNCHSGGHIYRYPRIILSLTAEDVVRRVAGMWGVAVYLPARGKTEKLQIFRVHIDGSGAAEWMRRLRPLVGSTRAARIDSILAEYDAKLPVSVRRRATCRAAALKRWRGEKKDG